MDEKILYLTLCIFFLVQICSMQEYRILQDYLFYAQDFFTETLGPGVDRWLMFERLHNPKFLLPSGKYAPMY